jgi:hypothetical protein
MALAAASRREPPLALARYRLNRGCAARGIVVIAAAARRALGMKIMKMAIGKRNIEMANIEIMARSAAS